MWRVLPSRQANGMGALYVNNNRNKRGHRPRSEEQGGKAIVEKLIQRSDVLLHNMRPDAADRLGLRLRSVAAINPRMIYCSAIGFGQRGRYRGRPAFDDVIQAAAGLAGIAEHNGEDPRFIPTILADKVGALHAVYGILAALVARANGRQDALRVEVPMFEALTSFVLNEHLAAATFQEDGKVGYSRVLSPDRGRIARAMAGSRCCPTRHEQWRRFLIEAGRGDVLDQPWFHQPDSRHAHIDYLYSVIASVLPQRDFGDLAGNLVASGYSVLAGQSARGSAGRPASARRGFLSMSASAIRRASNACCRSR